MFSHYRGVILEINYRGNLRNSQKSGPASLLNNKWVEEGITREIRKYFKMNEKTTGDQNLRDTVKAVLLGNFRVANIFGKKEKRAQINNVTQFLQN